MGPDFVSLTIGDLGRIVTGKTPPTKDHENYGGDIPFVSPRDLNGQRYVLESERTLTLKGAQAVKNAKIPRDSILVSCIGSDMGKAAIAARDCVTNQQINSLVVSPDFDFKYVYYNLSTRKEEIRSLAGGSAQPILNKTDFGKIEIDVPASKEEQQAVSSFLSALDDKIELNRQINTTLESMAQALFKSWFVDFDPVIDNALAAGNPIPEPLQARADKRAGLHVCTSDEDARRASAMDGASQKRAALLAAASAADTRSASAKDNAHPTQTAPHTQPGTKAPATPFQPLPADLRALFPGSFVFNEEMGWVPEGWEVTTFGNVSACFDSKRIPLSKRQREEKKPGEIPYYGATSVMDHINEWIFDDVYLLIGEDGSVIKEDGTPFTQYIWGRAWVNNHAHVLQGKEDVSTEHLMLFMQHQNMSAYVTGAVQLKINQKNMNSIPFVKASSELNKYFSSCIAPYYTKYRSCREQVETLSELRDSLLPKLLSGQIQISSVQNLAAGGLCNP